MQPVLLYFEPMSDLPNWVVICLFTIPFIGGLSYYAYQTRHAKSWRKGVFPQGLKPTEDNFLEAYLALGAKLILLNYQEGKGKTAYINSYFNRYFKFANYNFGDSLLFSLQHPIQTQTITDWLKIHLNSAGKRTQVVYFITGLCMVAGKINQRELNMLQQITRDLELPLEELVRIIAIHTAYQNQQKTSKTITPNFNERSNAFTVLGLAQNSSKEEIKKAYRKLVKLHHPDCFSNGSASQQKMAEAKFIEIQHAYELLAS